MEFSLPSTLQGVGRPSGAVVFMGNTIDSISFPFGTNHLVGLHHHRAFIYKRVSSWQCRALAERERALHDDVIETHLRHKPCYDMTGWCPGVLNTSSFALATGLFVPLCHLRRRQAHGQTVGPELLGAPDQCGSTLLASPDDV